jgi:hypothetical protein
MRNFIIHTLKQTLLGISKQGACYGWCTHWKVQTLKVQFGKPEGTRPFGKIKYMCEDKINNQRGV